MAQKPLVVSGRWFIPALFLGFVAFTIAMSWGTIVLGKAMRAPIEKTQIAVKRAEMEREMAARKVKEAQK